MQPHLLILIRPWFPRPRPSPLAPRPSPRGRPRPRAVSDPADGADDGYAKCHALGKPLWASEESSSYDDGNGAACWARVLSSHWVLSGISSSIMWNLVGSYYHGTNWYASSMLTAVQPWSGHFGPRASSAAGTLLELPVVWATAHVSQLSPLGWRFLRVGSGSGQLPKGGFYTTLIDPEHPTNFTLQVSHLPYH